MKDLSEIEDTLVAFHIGRGGSFYNPGYLTFIGEKSINYFTDDLFIKYENESDFKNRYGFDNTEDGQLCILDLISYGDFEQLEEKFGITEKMLGEQLYYDGVGNPIGLTVKQAETGVGCINIDNDYNTTYVIRLKDCTEGELKLIANYNGYITNKLQEHCIKYFESDEENS